MRAQDDRTTGQRQDQDPVERRRLQNRLSQRNHRRKIRDRIAKLQERVIASELKAAATLNGWNFNPPPQLSNPMPPFEMDRKAPQTANTALMPMMSYNLPCSPGTCYCNSTAQGFVYEAPKDLHPPSSPGVMTSGVCSPTMNATPLDIAPPGFVQDITPQISQDSFISQPSSIYYIVATEAAPTRPKTIILLPQDQSQGHLPLNLTYQNQPPTPGPSPTSNPNVSQNHNPNPNPNPVDWMSGASSPNCLLQPLDGYARME
ncbi:hypothetical protein BDV25DRAFT_136160 [Aspergillus avenaceus]|uniref:BZIP domain-containing protein n=1 Tax=Aspergillus avenaceus TaxID=36643 RepID=A0A5N6U6G8_ASPAV|nr:hypothetical protein BDV25DRAFT_136160 [Aspergillus avenaceus]